VICQARARPVRVLPELTLGLVADRPAIAPDLELDAVSQLVDRFDHDRVGPLVQDLDHPAHRPATLEPVAKLGSLASGSRAHEIAPTVGDMRPRLSPRRSGLSGFEWLSTAIRPDVR
jgi:hypothetical protein